MADKPNLYLVRAGDIAAHSQTFAHPWNPRSQISGAMLGRMAGLKRTGVSFARIPPGKESFVYHTHHCEEEWLYILSGRGTARIDGLQLAALPLDLHTPIEGQLQAAVEAAAELGGEGDILDTLQATADVQSFAGAWNGHPFRLEGPSRLRYARERLAIDQLRLVAQDSNVSVQGELPLTDRGAAGTIVVDAHANLATLAQYLPAGTEVTATGALTLAGQVRGRIVVKIT